MTNGSFTTDMIRLQSAAYALMDVPGMSPTHGKWPELLAVSQSMKELIDANAGHYAAHRAQKVGA